jgi:phosphoribosylglycinamide formyltransferase-1
LFKFADAKEIILIFFSKYLTNKIQSVAHFLLLCALINKIMGKRIAIFASGEGTNAENIIRYFDNNPNVDIKIVLCNRLKAGVLARASTLGIPAKSFSRADLYETDKVLGLLQSMEIDFIVLSGFMMMMPSSILTAFAKRIVNIHPALLPKFGGKGMFGMHVHEAVKTAGDSESGITIHYVNEKYDSGEIILQVKCQLSPTDSAEDIASKVHVLEYRYYPEVIEKVVMHL